MARKIIRSSEKKTKSKRGGRFVKTRKNKSLRKIKTGGKGKTGRRSRLHKRKVKGGGGGDDPDLYNIEGNLSTVIKTPARRPSFTSTDSSGSLESFADTGQKEGVFLLEENGKLDQTKGPVKCLKFDDKSVRCISTQKEQDVKNAADGEL